MPGGLLISMGDLRSCDFSRRFTSETPCIIRRCAAPTIVARTPKPLAGPSRAHAFHSQNAGNAPVPTDPRWPRSCSRSAVHEFRTPITVVAGYIRMLLKERAGPITDQQRKLLEEAEKSCGRLSALVAEMSDLSALEAGRRTFNRARSTSARCCGGRSAACRRSRTAASRSTSKRSARAHQSRAIPRGCGRAHVGARRAPPRGGDERR